MTEPPIFHPPILLTEAHQSAALKGTYVSVEPFHLDAYVKEQTFRFNERKSNDSGRFRAILGAVTGKRLTYKELKGYGEATA